MELHKLIKPQNTYNLSINDHYLDYFIKAYNFVNDNYADDLNRISSTKFNEITPEFFYKEYVWAVCASGFNARIVSGFFPHLMETLPLEQSKISSGGFLNDNEADITEALKIFNNKRKVVAIISVRNSLREIIKDNNWPRYRDNELNHPVKLTQLPFIGDITKYHLARNLGKLDYVKPDLHLERMSKHWKFKSPLEMCKAIQEKYEFPLGIIDLILFYSFSTFGSNA